MVGDNKACTAHHCGDTNTHQTECSLCTQAHVCRPLDAFSAYRDSRNPQSEAERNAEVRA